MKISRSYEFATITIDAEATATVIDVRNWASMSVKPSMAQTYMRIYVAMDSTYVLAMDKDGLDLVVTLNSTHPVMLPPEIFNYPRIKLVTDNQDTSALIFKKG